MVAPGTAAFGPPRATSHAGGCAVGSFIAVSKSFIVLPESILRTMRWCSSLPSLTRRRVVCPAEIDLGAAKAKSLAFTVTTGTLNADSARVSRTLDVERKTAAPMNSATGTTFSMDRLGDEREAITWQRVESRARVATLPWRGGELGRSWRWRERRGGQTPCALEGVRLLEKRSCGEAFFKESDPKVPQSSDASRADPRS